MKYGKELEEAPNMVLFKKTHKLSKEEKRRIEYWEIKLNLL